MVRLFLLPQTARLSGCSGWGGSARRYSRAEKFIRRPFRREDIPSIIGRRRRESADIRLEISKEGFADVQDWLGGENLYEANGKWYADVRLPDDDCLIRKLVGLGGNVKVLSPASVRERVRAEAEKILHLYL